MLVLSRVASLTDYFPLLAVQAVALNGWRSLPSVSHDAVVLSTAPTLYYFVFIGLYLAAGYIRTQPSKQNKQLLLLGNVALS